MSVRFRRRVLTTCLGAVAAGVAACSHDRATTLQVSARSESSAVPSSAADESASMDGYYLSTCAVCGGLLGAKGESPEVHHLGRVFRVCSHACETAFDREPDAIRERVDAVMIADQRPHYPLKVSLVSGLRLGPNPVEFIWGNRLFRVSSAAERGQILADPARYMRVLNREVIAAQAPTYGMPHKCPVQGDILPSDDVIDIVVANRMIRVCCGRCARVVKARPYQYLGMVEYANRHPFRNEQP